MIMRPNDPANLGRVIAALLQDLIDVLLDLQLETCGFPLFDHHLRAVLEVLPQAQVEEKGIMLTCCGWVAVFDQEAVRTAPIDP